MRRLLLKGKWPVAFQDSRCAGLCRAYEHAVDDALELALDERMNDNAIVAIEKAVDSLEHYLRSEPYFRDPQHQRETAEAREQLVRLGKTARLSINCLA